MIENNIYMLLKKYFVFLFDKMTQHFDHIVTLSCANFNPKNVLSKDEVLKLITHFIISFEQLFQIQN